MKIDRGLRQIEGPKEFVPEQNVVYVGHIEGECLACTSSLEWDDGPGPGEVVQVTWSDEWRVDLYVRWAGPTLWLVKKSHLRRWKPSWIYRIMERFFNTLYWEV